MDPSSIKTPSEFICPLTKTIMSEPVMTRYGTNFEKGAILSWLNRGNRVCPITQNPLRPSNLVSNKALSYKIQAYFQHSSTQFMQDGNYDQPISQDATTDLHDAFVTAVPPRFCCPITKAIMKHPVITRDGIRFEKAAILSWIEKTGDVCPLSGKPLCASNMIPDINLEWDIQQWQEKNRAGEIYCIDWTDEGISTPDEDDGTNSKPHSLEKKLSFAEQETNVAKLVHVMPHAMILKAPLTVPVTHGVARSA
jgi:U-box domain